MKTTKLICAGLLLFASFAFAGGSSRPAPSSTSAQSCKAASDCRGAVPKFCRACTNGKSGGCAHWSCIEGSCKISTCDLDPHK